MESNNGSYFQHLVAGSGGSRTILASTGVILAISLTDLRNLKTIGGVSGGAISSLLLAAGYQPSFIAREAIELDYSSLLTPEGSKRRILTALLLKNYFSWKRPPRGALNTESLGQYVESLVPDWPDRYWTAAADADSLLVFTRDGTYRLRRGFSSEKVSDRPPSIGVAIRATCAVPGLITPPILDGRPLYDGMLSHYGRCPVRLPSELIKADPRAVLAVDSGEEPGLLNRLSYLFWGVAFNGPRWLKQNWRETTNAGEASVISPVLGPLPSLRFSLPAIVKWSALCAGLVSGLEFLQVNNLLSKENQLLARQATSRLSEIALSVSDDDEKVNQMKNLLVGLQLY